MTPLKPPLKYEKFANQVLEAIKSMKIVGFSKLESIPIDKHLAP